MELQQQNQISELKKAMQTTKNNHLHDRYQAVYLHLSGYTMTEITQIIGHTRKTIGCYVAAYREGGIESLTPRQASF
jgi:putative transposase